MTRETTQQREKRLAEALRRNLNRRKQAARDLDEPAPPPKNREDGSNSGD